MSGPKASELQQTNPEASKKENSRPVNPWMITPVGSPMITADLHDDPEFCDVGKNRIARLMKEMGLKYTALKKFVVTTDSKRSEP